jgi:hypothetical protein
MSENLTLFLILIFVNFPLYIWVGKSFYDSWWEFTEGLRMLYQPGWLSALRGEWDKDFWGTLKILLYVFICFALVYTQLKLIVSIFY